MKKNRGLFVLLFTLLFNLTNGSFFAQTKNNSNVNVAIVSDEADAIISILNKKKMGLSTTDQDWNRLTSSEGYMRLKKRADYYKNPLSDSVFQSFVLSDPLLKRVDSLSETLEGWKIANINALAQKAFAYLPEEAKIKAKIYPVIKGSSNSFVFEVDTDPGIFIYLDPTVSKEKFENTLAHELHHIGYSSTCKSKMLAEISPLPQNVQTVLQWAGAFGEGFAMLAAAGGPDIHPHQTSKPSERLRWDADMKNFNDSLRRVEKFFLDILDNKLSKEETNKIAFSFFGIQGPWYIVGWKMAVTVEKIYGREKLIECICHQKEFLPTYNNAAKEYNKTAKDKLETWSEKLIEKITN